MKLNLLIATLVSVSLAGCFANSSSDDNDPCTGMASPDGLRCSPPPNPLPANTTCAGASCDVPPPSCPEGEVPLVDETGCYTGECIPFRSCDVAPPCNTLNTEALCSERAECEAVYGGINCRDPQGNACDANGDASTCTCEAFVFARCALAA